MIDAPDEWYDFIFNLGKDILECLILLQKYDGL